MSTFRNEPALERFAESIIALVQRVRREATPSGMQDLTATQRSVLMKLDAEGPMSSAALARAEGITPQSMGTALAWLEQQGHVERAPHPTDGRQALMSLTHAGKALRKATREAKEKWLETALSMLSPHDRAVVLEAGDILERLLEKWPQPGRNDVPQKAPRPAPGPPR